MTAAKCAEFLNLHGFEVTALRRLFIQSTIMSTSPAPTLTTAEETSLITAAFSALEVSYAPYSNFRVGAALMTFSGKIHIGGNIENAAYPAGTCAERAAFATSISAGDRKFKALAVVSDVNEPISPCGVCRQFIREFCSDEMPIILVPAGHVLNPVQKNRSNAEVVYSSLAELLPRSFGPDFLAKPQI